MTSTSSDKSEEDDFPDKNVCLVPMNNKLLENENLWCRELLNLYSALKSPNKANKKTTQVSEEESHYLSEHISTE